ncbi:hypothetical protein B0H16DRAFT_1722755 [Mycena metata]|uniref:Uncharacterized protein n=1 Tax=Mycena metata TaxID=1033252 RepID=A0AAD7J254_9AGAR|nr:hypothetical protein B0H16DRAFT_1722755 [Mycena metata]
MSSSQLASTASPTLRNSVSNYIELAALVIPQKKTGISHRLRGACAVLPMPLSLGWDADSGDDEAAPDPIVPGLLLSDVGSGATRHVTARWMHSLYKHILETQKPGTYIIHLREASYTQYFGRAHSLLLLAFLLQLSFILFLLVQGQRRDGWLLIAAALIRIFEGILHWAFPEYRDPRTNETAIARYCALHTGMTTNHLLVITHRFHYRGRSINLEDAARPLPRKSEGWKRKALECGARIALQVSIWLHKIACIVTDANGYTIPGVLLFGTLVLEGIAVSAHALPVNAVTVLTTGPSVLDRLTAACQFTESISVGFVESLLPDPRGHHTDYEWIRQAIQADTTLERHPTHPTADTVLESTLRRRRPGLNQNN